MTIANLDVELGKAQIAPLTIHSQAKKVTKQRPRTSWAFKSIFIVFFTIIAEPKKPPTRRSSKDALTVHV